jgi:hypothetical protein
VESSKPLSKFFSSDGGDGIESDWLWFVGCLRFTS